MRRRDDLDQLSNEENASMGYKGFETRGSLWQAWQTGPNRKRDRTR